ncbi:T9SS type A sorting domain-containing protein [bacterium]|nr:T9SS type A sorting domain-containing protein [bacterium]
MPRLTFGVTLLAVALWLLAGAPAALAQCDSLLVYPEHTGSGDAVHVGSVSHNLWVPCAPRDPDGVNWVWPFSVPFACNNLDCLRIESSGSDAATSEVRIDGLSVGFLTTDPGPDCDFVLTELTGITLPPGIHMLSVHSNGGPDFAFHDIRFVCPAGSTLACAESTTVYLPVPSSEPTFDVPLLLTGTNAPLGQWGMHAVFDSTRLTFDSVTPSDWDCFAGYPVAPDSIRIEGCDVPARATTNPDTLAFLHFESPGPHMTGTDWIRTTEFLDDFVGLLDWTSEVTYVPCGHGDVNGSGLLSLADAVCSWKCFLNFDMMTGDCLFAGIDCERNAADVNCDGVCSPTDALWIADYAVCGGTDVVHCAGEGLPCPSPARAVPPATVSAIRIGPAEIARGVVQRIPVELRGAGLLRAFGIDVAIPEGLTVSSLERSEATARWVALDASVRGATLRLGGYDLTGIDLRDDEWVRVGELEVYAEPDAEAALRFEPVDFIAGVDGAQWSPEEIRLEGNATPAFTTFQLGVPQPNPSRGAVRVSFRVPAGPAQPVRVTVYDVAGRAVRTLRERAEFPGEHTTEWDGRDDAGRAVAPGAYFFRLRSGDFEATRKIVRTR